MSIASIPKKFAAYLVPCVILKNEARTIEVGGMVRRTPNTLVNDWDLIGYEVHGNPTEIIGPAGWRKIPKSGVGYICDEVGVTVSLTRNGPKKTPDRTAENNDIVFGKLEAIAYKFKAETVPYILISNNGLTLTWGGHIRNKGRVLTDGPGKPVYQILGDMVEIVNLQTGESGMGYVCDETGVTVNIIKDFYVVKAPSLLKKPEVAESDKVEVKVKFSGGIGRLSSFDRIPEIFNIGQSKKNFYMGLAVGLFVMFIIRLLV